MADLLKNIDDALLAAYDRYMLKAGSRLTLEEYREAYFQALQPIKDSDELNVVTYRYINYRSQRPSTQITFSAYVRMATERPKKKERRRKKKEKESEQKEEEESKQPQEEESKQMEEADMPIIEEVTEEEKPALQLTSGVQVNGRLLNKWRDETLDPQVTDWKDSFTAQELRELKDTMKQLCNAGDKYLAKQARPFKQSDISKLPSSCHRHRRLRHTHEFETAHSAEMSGDGGPHYLVFYRNPHTEAVQKEVVTGGELSNKNMQIMHTFISSSGLFSYLKRKLNQLTGRGLDSSISKYFSNKERFAEAVEVAEQVFENTSSRDKAADERLIITRLLNLSQNNIDLLYALTQYLCTEVKRGDVSKLPSGACSLQSMHSMVTHVAKRDEKRPSVIEKKAILMGYGCLTKAERRSLLAYLNRKPQFLASSARAVLPRTDLNPPELKTIEEWRLEAMREELTKDVAEQTAKRKAGMKLHPTTALINIESGEFDFVDDLRKLFKSDAEFGIGVWLIPNNEDYRRDKRRTLTRDYFNHFFIDMNPKSSRGSQNRSSVNRGLWWLTTDSDTRVVTIDLFPTEELQNSFRTTLSALAADVMQDPETDRTLAVELERVPDTLFTAPP